MKVKTIFPLLALLALPASLPRAGATAARQTAPGAAQPQAGRYHALLIGNDDYASLPKLKTAVADAREVERVLRETYGFQTKLLLNAGRAQIVSALSAYRRELGPDANLVIYYAGHGYNDKEAGKAYWLPVDASRDDTSNWIIADEITTGIRVIPARHVLVISDSCYSGTLTRGLSLAPSAPSAREQYLRRMAAGHSRTLMASGGDEPVADGGGGGHSVFASALLRGLRQIDKPQFTAAELFSGYVVEPVAGRAEQTPVYDPLRNSGHESGDFVFVKVKSDGKTVEVTVNIPPPPRVDPAQQELTFWTTIQNSTDAEDFKDYLSRYPNGLYAGIARRRLAALSVAAKPVPTPTPVSTSADTASAAKPKTDAPKDVHAERLAPGAAAAKMLSLNFNSASAEPTANGPIGEGIVISSGIMRIESTEPSDLVMPAGLKKVAFFIPTLNAHYYGGADPICAELTFTAGDVAAVSVTRPGVANGASTPAWRLQAFNAGGAQVGETVGEGDIVGGNFLFPKAPQDFTITAAGIRKLRICSKNHQSTFNAIPIARISYLKSRDSSPPANTSPAAPPPARPKPGTVFRARSGIELVYVPPGEFLMGSESGEADADEKPAHRVTIREGFWMGKYEVTQGQWQAVMGNNPSRFMGCDACPVEQVSWNGAQEFISKLNAQDEGFTYRLPTEAEWEYACRAGTTGEHAGNLDSRAWYNANSGGKTHPVGGKQPNGFGLYDMNGNVWEWVQDYYHENYNGAPSDGSAWLSGGASGLRVMRGGSWPDYAANFPGPASRVGGDPADRFTGNVGFRVVAVARQ